jgi:hypothetical protein
MRGGARRQAPLLPLFLLLGLADSAAADDALWLACAAITEDSARLACFDDVARARTQTKALADTEAFGVRAKAPLPAIEDISSRVAKVAVTSSERRVITLENGQVWAENEPGYRSIRVGDDVTITRKSLRYSMRLPSGLQVAVHRVE